MVHTAGWSKLACNQIYRFQTEKVGFMMNRIKELRKQKNLTLKQLSESLKEKGLSLSTDSLSKYERGVRNPKIENWEKLAEFFNVSIAYLKGGKQKNCPYCHGLIGENQPLDISPNRKARLDMASSGFFEYTMDGLVTHVGEQYFNYCPMCRRDLRSNEKFHQTYR